MISLALLSPRPKHPPAVHMLQTYLPTNGDLCPETPSANRHSHISPQMLPQWQEEKELTR